MERFKKILVFVEKGPESEYLVKYAHQLAKAHEAELTLAEVVEDLPQTIAKELAASMDAAQTPAIDLHHVFIDNARKELDRYVESLRGDTVSVIAKVLCGRPYVAIGREVMSSGHQLLLKNVSHHENDSFFLGPADMQLLRQNPCPVWIVRSNDRTSSKTIVAAIDALPGTPSGNAVNKHILQIANTIASSESADLHVVSAWSLYKEGRLRSQLPDAVMKQFSETTTVNVNSGLRRIFESAEIELDDDHLHVRRGHAAKIIVDIVNELDADLLIIGTMTHTDTPAFQMGNTADAVLRQITCSVLAVKPRDYIAPLVRFSEDPHPHAGNGNEA